MKNILLFIFLFTFFSCSEKEKPNAVNNMQIAHVSETSEFIKAVHYFASSWVLTFWQEFEKDQVEQDFIQIKADGFNTIILVVPWKGFELEFEKEQTTSNQKMYEKLGFLLEKAKEKGLKYILRLGYSYDLTPNTGTDFRALCANMYQSDKTRNKWLSYLNKIKNITDLYTENIAGVLISWEDFWCPHVVFPTLKKDQRIELAKNIGYSQWLMKKYSNNFSALDEIVIPLKEDASYLYYLEFIDKKFNELILNSAKTVFPTAAMEIRVDKDPVNSSDGKKWIPHDLHHNETNHRGTYWAPFWGAENRGEKLSLSQTLFNFEYFLNYVSNQGQSINHIIDQFNFSDNTPAFPNSAVIEPGKTDAFLLKSVPLLKKYAKGYGVWAYRDYVDNALYNGSFEVGLDGWDTQGEIEIIGNSNDQQLKMHKDSFISQSFISENRFAPYTGYKQVKLCIKASNTGSLKLYTGTILESTLDLISGDNCFEIDAQNYINTLLSEFKLVAQSDVVIDEIKLYSFVQRLGLYNEFNQPGQYIQTIRQMNSMLY